MNVDTFGDADDDPLLWVMGWGNVASSRHERWLIDRFVDAGYHVHAAELPTNSPAFQAEYVAPVRSYIDELTDPALVAHSMGGLTTAHVGPDRPVVYLSPWWGMDDGDLPAVARLLFRLPTSWRVLPNPGEPAALGELATEADVTSPDRISPKWIATMRRAHATLPPIDPEDVVFYTPSDEVVDPAAIEAHTEPDQRRRYEGGHELFASADRDAVVDDVLDELDGP